MSKRNRRPQPVAPVRNTRTRVACALLAAVALGVGFVLGAKTSDVTITDTVSPADHAGLDTFVDKYFSTWSNQDMVGYGSCFHPKARIWYIAPDGSTDSLALEPFLQSQERAHAQSPVRMREFPLSREFRVHNGLADVSVHWQLEEGSRITRGYDFYTLVRTGDSWRIVSLVFNVEPEK